MSDRTLLKYAGGWLLIAAGALILIAALSPIDEAVPETYLLGVWTRSFENPLQLGLLAAALAIVPHFLWSLARKSSPSFADAYDGFAAWGQAILTSLGFLGTVIGVSMAVAGLEQAMMEQEPVPLIRGLSTAFDTTFLGLSGAILLLLMRRMADIIRAP